MIGLVFLGSLVLMILCGFFSLAMSLLSTAIGVLFVYLLVTFFIELAKTSSGSAAFEKVKCETRYLLSFIGFHK